MTATTAYAEANSSTARPFYDEEPACFIDGLEGIINGFRLPGGEFYNQLVGSERAALPSIESQVTHLKDEICLWVSGAIEGAADVDFCTEDPLYAESRDQVRYLCNQSTVTQGQYLYWESDYRSQETNPGGQFVAWATRRKLRPVIKEAVEALTPQPSGDTQGSSVPLFSHMPGALSSIAKMKNVRRTAYQARMDAKIGLACMRAITPESIPHLEEYFQLHDTEETPDLMALLTRKQHLAELGFSWLQPVAAEIMAMPF